MRSFAEVNLGYSREEAVREARRGGHADLGPARRACPFGVDIPTLVASIARGDFDAAKAAVVQAHPWPEILGRWCIKHCERAHSLGEAVEPLFISALERAAGEHGSVPPLRFAPAKNGKRVAVLGAGSAGSGAAFRLRQIGYEVVVYDRLPVFGGMMAMGYPEFRLPYSVVRRENDPADWFADLCLEAEIDRALFDRVRGEFDAVVIATGKVKEAKLGIPGEDLEGVWDALEVLRRVKLGRSCPLGEDVAVFGAGYTAQDASRVARRLGRRVAIYYRRGIDEMPVSPRSRDRYILQQEREGAPYVFHVAPIRIVGRAGRVVGVACVRTEHGDLDASGRRAPLVVPDSEFVVDCDTVIVATGEQIDASFAPPELELADGKIRVTDDFETSLPQVYAVGSAAGFESTDAAYSSGMRCAEVIDRQLSLVGRGA
ncbi:MAG: FAD-dependent oxidoreductase [Candidatus Eremiobacteraeota bacterium]|nr:FAD-dependent oxidoreductase [Candidatus Eremiobacteraeota bacterium]